MPGVTVHMIAADRALDVLERSGEAPFATRDPEVRNAFYHGAVGPDLGYFPGGFRPLSELAHYLRTGEICRSLVGRARRPVEQAFALGWLTHVLADAHIHPLVGRALAQLHQGRLGDFVDGTRDRVGHVRIETGLDAYFALQAPSLHGRRLFHTFDSTSVAFLEGAYRETYGVDLDNRRFLVSHRASSRGATRGLALVRWLGQALGHGSRGCSSSTTRSLRRSVIRTARAAALMVHGSESLTRAFLDPVPPPRWLVAEVRGRVDVCVHHFLGHLRSSLRALENRNLDTGRLEVESGDHPGTIAALAARRALVDSRAPEAAPALPHPMNQATAGVAE